MADKLPEIYTTTGALLNQQQLGTCAVTEDWLTSVRGLASYTIPKVDVLVSGSFRSTPAVAPAGTSVASNGAALAANYNVTSAILQAQTGRPLAPGLAFLVPGVGAQGGEVEPVLAQGTATAAPAGGRPGGGLLVNDTRVLEARVVVTDPNPTGKHPLRVGQKVRVNFGP